MRARWEAMKNDDEMPPAPQEASSLCADCCAKRDRDYACADCRVISFGTFDPARHVPARLIIASAEGCEAEGDDDEEGEDEES